MCVLNLTNCIDICIVSVPVVSLHPYLHVLNGILDISISCILHATHATLLMETDVFAYFMNLLFSATSIPSSLNVTGEAARNFLGPILI